MNSCCYCCDRPEQFKCKQCNNSICIVHSRLIHTYDKLDSFCNFNCIDKHISENNSDYSDEEQEEICFSFSPPIEYKTKPIQKKSKELTTIELTYEDTINLRRILSIANRHLNLNMKLRETRMKVLYQTK